MDGRSVDISKLITDAKAGDELASQQLLQRYRNYLRIIALDHSRDNGALRSRFDASDLVQNTMLDAFRDIASFRGNTEPELIAWLRQILARNLADLMRVHFADKRDVRRQVSLDAALSHSSQRLEQLINDGTFLVKDRSSKHEMLLLFADAMAKLPEHYQQVIMLRHTQRASFEEIAVEMDRSAVAVRLLWMRALSKFKKILDEDKEKDNSAL